MKQKADDTALLLGSVGCWSVPSSCAARAEQLCGEHLNLHGVWQHHQLLQTSPGKPGRVMGASSCIAVWWHYSAFHKAGCHIPVGIWKQDICPVSSSSAF